MTTSPGQLVDPARADLHVRLYIERHVESSTQLHIRLYTDTRGHPSGALAVLTAFAEAAGQQGGVDLFGWADGSSSSLGDA